MYRVRSLKGYDARSTGRPLFVLTAHDTICNTAKCWPKGPRPISTWRQYTHALRAHQLPFYPRQELRVL